MRTTLFYLLIALFLFSCKSEKTIPLSITCKNLSINNTELHKDFSNTFSIEVPKSWKVNLYNDNVQSSIYTADTTKNLTNSILLDVSLVSKKEVLNEVFFLELEQENLRKSLVRTQFLENKNYNTHFYHTTYKGFKRKIPYQKNQIHIKKKNNSFLVATIEIYGDSLVEQRLCKAISIVKTLKF